MSSKATPAPLNFQDLILRLQEFWAQQGCAILQSYDMPMGAGTFHPATFLRAVGPEPWSAAYVQPSRRPTDGRYGDNPFRLQHYYQYQVVLKPSPDDMQALYLDSLRALGVDTSVHDIRFVEDNWESPTLGAWGLGWEVWLNGRSPARLHIGSAPGRRYLSSRHLFAGRGAGTLERCLCAAEPATDRWPLWR